MSTTNTALESTINAVLASNPNLTVKDLKSFFIKDGGYVIYPTKDADGKLHLSKTHFVHEAVAAARATKKAEREQLKADKALKLAQEKAAKAAAKAQEAAAKAKAKAEALEHPTAVASQPVVAGESTVTVIGSSAV